MASQQIVISSIKFNTTFVHTIRNFTFDNLPIEKCVEIFKDGRAFSHFIEPWLEKNYPSLKHIKGCKGHDFEDIYDVDIKYDQKTFTDGGCNFMPSNMVGQGRKFDQEVFNEKTSKLLYIIIGNINFPEIKIKFVRGTDLVVDYPKGKIPFKDFNKFFGTTTNSNSNPEEWH
jgi:hypothetical protein